MFQEMNRLDITMTSCAEINKNWIIIWNHITKTRPHKYNGDEWVAVDEQSSRDKTRRHNKQHNDYKFIV